MYHHSDLAAGTDALVQQIATASAAERLTLQPQLTRLVETLQRAGKPVPPQVRNLNDRLVEEAIEARFDNLPV